MSLEFVQDENPITQKKLPEKVLVEVEALPSNFLCYPTGSQVFYSPFKLGELELLNSGSINFGQALENLIESITTVGFDKQDLAYFDLIYIGIKRKLTALGDVRGTLTGYCPKCGAENQKEFVYTEIDFSQPKAPKLPAVFNTDKGELKFSLLTYRKWVELSKLPDSGRISALAHMVTNLDYDDAKAALDALTGEDILFLDEIELALDYGIKPMHLECSGIIEPEEEPEVKGKKKKELVPTVCGNKFKVEVTNPFDFTFRTCRSAINVESKIRFGE